MNRIISPSLLSADFSILKEQIDIVKKAGAKRLHIDCMDGHFVPNFTFGPFIVKAIRKLTDLHLETHLMIDNPSNYFDDFIKAGSDTLIFHYEASNDIMSDLKKIKSKNVKCGLAIKPETSHKVLEKFIDILDYILIMSVSPGFGGQGFIEDTLLKMKLTHEMCIKNNRRNEITIGVDGGVNLSTIDKVYNTGIDVTVVGSGLYKADNIIDRFKELENQK
jgi:ribulose-phosphate 3-epimerase|tara:strand:- start:1419 stop:2078 length:660 start_codon:yes stop_codon:yes gene_type:complete